MSLLTNDVRYPRLNLGCGDRFCPDWINIDFVCHSEGVIQINLLEELPFQDNSFDLVYSSHMLEHFSPVNAEKLMLECHRVMRPSAILRIVVPDLEVLARAYLNALDECSDDSQAIAIHDWSIIQLIDQCTRDEPGGEMIKFLNNVSLRYAETIGKTSKTANDVLSARIRRQSDLPVESCNVNSRNKCVEEADGFFSRCIGKFRRIAKSRVPIDFSMIGEKHKWMYDRKSLTRLFNRCGFRDVRVVDAEVSRCVEWNRWYLDRHPDGTIYRPDSLFIEGIK